MSNRNLYERNIIICFINFQIRSWIIHYYDFNQIQWCLKCRNFLEKTKKYFFWKRSVWDKNLEDKKSTEVGGNLKTAKFRGPYFHVKQFRVKSPTIVCWKCRIKILGY